MTPPIWLDGYGHRLATHPSRRCGTEVPIGQTYRYEHLRMIGWSVFEEVTIVARCGHQHHFHGGATGRRCPRWWTRRSLRGCRGVIHYYGFTPLSRAFPTDRPTRGDAIPSLLGRR